MINQDMERALLGELSPVIEDSYETHMSTGPRRSHTKATDVVAGTLHPLGTLYETSGLEAHDYVTPELVEAVRSSHQDHIERYRQQGVDLSPAIAVTGLMNLGTEDNISWYHAKQYAQFRDFPAYTEMLSRWTAEESDHGPLIEDWGAYARAIPSAQAHLIKVNQIMSGIHVPVDSIVSTNAFTDPQEGDTVDAHNALSDLLDPVGRRVMRLMAGHEARHMRMFRRIAKGIYSIDDSFIEYALPIEAETHAKFAMPGEQGVPNFNEMAKRIAVHGLFTLEGVIERQRQRVEDLGLLDFHAKTDAAKQAQEKIQDVIDPQSRRNTLLKRLGERARDTYIKTEKEAGRIPVILGQTVVMNAQKQLEVKPEAV